MFINARGWTRSWVRTLVSTDILDMDESDRPNRDGISYERQVAPEDGIRLLFRLSVTQGSSMSGHYSCAMLLKEDEIIHLFWLMFRDRGFGAAIEALYREVERDKRNYEH